MSNPNRTQQTTPLVAMEVSPPTQPMHVARNLAGQYPEPITWWQGDFYEWTGQHWRLTDQDAVESWLWRALEHAFYTVKEKDEEVVKAWNPTTKRVSDVMRALSRGALLRKGDHDRVLAVTNGVLDLDTRTLADHNPAVFNLSTRPFAYDAEATAPTWAKFLDEVLPGEDGQQDQAFLQEWFGYILTGRTSIHKMAVLAGESRSGKGTILRVMRAIVGDENTVAGSLDGIVADFGLEPMIGKSLLSFGDVRWNNSNAQKAIQRILEISGEDVQTVNRKGRAYWTGTLGVRIVFAGNNVPRFNDPSGAMANRMHIVHFGQSFAGREDWGLTDRLLDELPGIFNWAIDGLDRLNATGAFTTSETSRSLKQRVGEASDRLGQFCDEYLELGADLTMLEDDLVEAYSEWTERTNNRRDTASAESLREQLLDRFQGVTNDKHTRKSVRVNGSPRKVRAYQGLGLLHPVKRLVEGKISGEVDESEAF